MDKYYITIKKEHSGKRLDKVIPDVLPQISRRQARKLIETGAVSIDRKRNRTLSRPVQEGETVIIYRGSETRTVNPDESPLEILHDDPWFVVINKPSGTPADATREGLRGTVIDILSETFPGKTIRTVHRLDMGTSGVMVVSKTAAATRDLNTQFQRRQVEKSYQALVHGQVNKESGRIITFIDRDPNDARKFRSVACGGKEAQTEYHVLSEYSLYTLLSAVILTGRTHQIRVHFSEMGHPVVGDRLYGMPDDPAPRLMLHAASLAFRNPRTGEMLSFEAGIPSIFSEYADTSG
ncbi:RluA family pseudouridine synthase [bacterium]|nr:RluA family pseudouridine synthase [candidate division CSSED10-310 bacterium]